MSRKHSLKNQDWFWGKVEKSDNPNDCWPWKGYHLNGYGRVQVSGKMKLAHRLAYYFSHGELPQELCVCHKCDNPPCCNPNHLFLGTHSENMSDMNRKKVRNFARGERQGGSKVSDLQVAEIRMAYAQGEETRKSLSLKYGISKSQVDNIVNGKQRT